MGKGSRANWGPLHGIGGTQELSSRGGPTFTGILTFVPRKKLGGNPGGQTRHDIFPGVRPAEGLGTAKGVPGGGGGLGAELGFPVPGACGPYQDARAPLESLVLAVILVSAARSQSPRTSPPLKCPCRQSCSQSREKGPNQASQHRRRKKGQLRPTAPGSPGSPQLTPVLFASQSPCSGWRDGTKSRALALHLPTEVSSLVPQRILWSFPE